MSCSDHRWSHFCVSKQSRVWFRISPGILVSLLLHLLLLLLLVQLLVLLLVLLLALLAPLLVLLEYLGVCILTRDGCADLHWSDGELNSMCVRPYLVLQSATSIWELRLYRQLGLFSESA